MALHCLESLGNSPEMRALMSALLPKAVNCKEELKAPEVLSVIHGLQYVDDSQELRECLAALVPKVNACRGYLRVYQLDDVLQILETFSDCNELRQLTAALTPTGRNPPEIQSSPQGYETQTDYGGVALNGAQAWENTGMMQELVRALEQDHTGSTWDPTPTSSAPNTESPFSGRFSGVADQSVAEAFGRSYNEAIDAADAYGYRGAQYPEPPLIPPPPPARSQNGWQ
jgi:hypothetical protein